MGRGEEENTESFHCHNSARYKFAVMFLKLFCFDFIFRGKEIVKLKKKIVLCMQSNKLEGKTHKIFPLPQHLKNTVTEKNKKVMWSLHDRTNKLSIEGYPICICQLISNH